MRLPSDYSQIVVNTYSILVALIVLTPFVLPRLYEINISQLTHPTIWGGLLYLSIVSTAGGFLLWNRGLQVGGYFSSFNPWLEHYLDGLF